MAYDNYLLKLLLWQTDFYWTVGGQISITVNGEEWEFIRR